LQGGDHVPRRDPAEGKMPQTVPLTEKYRPGTFSSLYGQGHLAESFRDAIRRGPEKPIILAGPSGTGKTSALQLLARGFLCDTAQEGEHCGSCEQCRQFAETNRHPSYLEVHCGEQRNVSEIEEYLETINRTPLFGSSRVLAVDEAHRLTPATQDALLGFLERPPSWAACILATDKVEKLQDTLRSRCNEFHLIEVIPAERLTILQQICDAEHIQYETSGLDSIIQCYGSNVRRHINDLQQVVQRTGAVTADNVRRALGPNKGERIARYFRALSAGDRQGQIDAFMEWPDAPFRKALAVHDLLFYLRTTCVLRLRWECPAGAAMPPKDQADIVDRLESRAKRSAQGSDVFWRGAIAYWHAEESLSAAALVQRALDFEIVLGPAGAEGESRDVPEPLGAHPSKARQWRCRVGRPSSTIINEGGAEQLNRTQVQGTFNAASFLIQEVGVALNSEIFISHERLGISHDEEASSLVGDLVHELGMSLKRWGCAHFHWLYAHTRSSLGGLTSTLAIHIEPGAFLLAEEWLTERFIPNRYGYDGVEALSLDFLEQDATRDVATAYHWNLVRKQVRSLDPKLQVRGGGETRGLAELLSINVDPTENFLPVHVVQKRRASGTIGKRAQRRSATDGFPMLSAFDDGAFSWIYGGWEWLEHSERLKAKSEFLRACAAIELRWPRDKGRRMDELRQTQLEEIKAALPKDPRQRLRSWTTWSVPLPEIRQAHCGKGATTCIAS